MISKVVHNTRLSNSSVTPLGQQRAPFVSAAVGCTSGTGAGIGQVILKAFVT